MSQPHNANVADLLRSHAARDPDRVAVHFPTPGGRRQWDTMTFGEVDRAADDYARGFAAAGLRPGDRTLLMVRPSSDFYGMVFGLFRAGAVPVFIDPGMGLTKALGCVEQIAPRGIIAMSPVHAVRTVYRRPFQAAEVLITAGYRWWWGGSTLTQCRRGDGPAPDYVAKPDDDAVIVFTSGSTGSPKGVSMTHRCMRARVRLIQEMLGLREGEVISETLLVYTILEMSMGMTVVIPPMDLAKPAKVDPAEVVATIQAFEPSVASASPVVWQRLVRHCLEGDIQLPTLRMLLTSAAPIPVDLHGRLAEVVPSTTELFTPYGATEAMPVAFIGTRTILDETASRTATGEGTCVGTLAPEMDVRLIRVTDDPIPTWTEDLRVADGEVGEIVAAGEGVSQAYRNAEQGNALAKIREGDRILHRMGDLGRLDAEGRLWFCGRKSHRLETIGGLVPCVAVEGVFNAHPQVYRTALVGAGPRGEEAAVLCVELEEGVVWSDTIRLQLEALASKSRWEGLVQRFLPHPGFPTDARHNSKIRREDLRVWAAPRAADLVTTAT